VDREDRHEAQFLGERGEPLHDGTVDRLCERVVLPVLRDAEVRAVEELLEADRLGALRCGVVHELLVLVEHRLLVAGPGGLSDCDANHGFLLRGQGLRRAPASRAARHPEDGPGGTASSLRCWWRASMVARGL